MRVLWVLLFATTLITGYTQNARAQGVCPYPYPHIAHCETGGGACEEYKLWYECTIYASGPDTCACYAQVKCCGLDAGPDKMLCSTTCAGCEPSDDQETADPEASQPEAEPTAPVDSAKLDTDGANISVKAGKRASTPNARLSSYEATTHAADAAQKVSREGRGPAK
jgi:hypothetical protein